MFSTVDLVSPHPPEECARRVREQSDRAWVLTSRKPVVGRADAATLRLHKRISYRNSFQTYLVAALVAQGGGTRLRCRFGPHPAVLAFMVVWFAGVAAIGGSAVIAALRDGFASDPGAGDQGVFLVVPLLMLCGGVALVLFGRYLARDEQRFLLDFLRDTIAARGGPAGAR